MATSTVIIGGFLLWLVIAVVFALTCGKRRCSWLSYVILAPLLLIAILLSLGVATLSRERI